MSGVESSLPDRPRVLVVDDERINLDTFRRVFRKVFQVALAQSAAEALRLVAEQSYDVALVDYQMPDMLGTALLADLAELDPGLERILLTAYGDLDEVRLARSQGLCSRVVRKPWKRDEIIRIVGDRRRRDPSLRSTEPRHG